MKTLNKLLIPVLAVAFSFNSYSQTIETTENGFRQYNEKNQLIRIVLEGKNYKSITNYEYDKKGNKIKEIYKIDKENDGEFDYLAQWDFVYNEKGKIIRTHIMKDNDADGEFDEIKKY